MLARLSRLHGRLGHRLHWAAAALCLLVAIPAAAQDAPKGARLPRVGFCFVALPEAEVANHSHASARYFLDGLRKLGWNHGGNVEVIFRSGAGRAGGIGECLAHLVDLPVEVIVTFGDDSVAEAQKRTRSIPIVANLGDIALSKHSDSFSRPTGNVTGVTNGQVDALVKAMSLLKEAADVRRIVFLYAEKPSPGLAPGLKPAAEMYAPLLSAATDLGITIAPLVITAASQLEGAFSALAQEGRTGLMVQDSSLWREYELQGTRLEELIVRFRLPAMVRANHPSAIRVGGGFLVARGPVSQLERIPVFVDRLLRGARVADLPIELPREFRLGVNLEVAKKIGIVMPPSIVLRADVVVDNGVRTAR